MTSWLPSGGNRWFRAAGVFRGFEPRSSCLRAGQGRMRATVAYLNMKELTTAVFIKCLLAMTYDNAPPCAPLVRTTKAVRKYGDERPSATAAVRLRPPPPESEGRLGGGRNCRGLRPKTGRQKNLAQENGGETGLER
jgi:hypothetical protein